MDPYLDSFSTLAAGEYCHLFSAKTEYVESIYEAHIDDTFKIIQRKRTIARHTLFRYVLKVYKRTCRLDRVCKYLMYECSMYILVYILNIFDGIFHA